ncbi:MAG: hypothetical protein IAE95_14320 [Chitinophagaceae bacterium]|nr:hypothetical protein [Chitinophagaceae bacterium]
MSGNELKGLMFAEHGSLSEFATYSGMSRQNLNRKLEAKKPDEEMLRRYAEFKGYDADNFVKWARGPVTNEAYSEQKKLSGTRVDWDGKFKIELKKIYAENVELHKTIADRGTFIIELLDK